MSSIVTLNGIPYVIPDTGEVGWGQQVHNYLVAIGSGGVLTLEGGNFPLLNEVNFGPNYGIASPYFRSGLDPAATQGVLRLTNNESIMWRNSANTGNLTLNIVGDQLYFAGFPIGGGTTSPLTTKGDLYTYTSTNARLPVGLNGTVLVADSSTPTGLNWLSIPGVSGSVTGFSFTPANGIGGSVTNPTTTPNLTLSLGNITPLSVASSGTVTGSNLSGTHTGNSSGTNTGDQTITLTGDITGTGTSSFAVTYAGVVPINKGGTGQITANASLNALVPSQTGNSGKVLQTDGFNTSWQNFPGAGSVTSVSGVANNGTTITVSNPTTTPIITIGLGNITPTSVASSGTVTGSNISGSVSGTNTGDQTISLSGDVLGTGTGAITTSLVSTGVTPGGYTLTSLTVDSKGRITSAASGTPLVTTLTGDVTGSGTGTFATTLSNTGIIANTYNNITVDSKGRAIAGSNVSYLTGNQTITISGDATGSGTTSIPLTLANTTVAAGTYNFTTLTVDSKGRLTAASSGSPVTSVSVVSANGITGSVANPTTTPAITLTLGNITPSSVAASGTVTGSNLSGTHTGNSSGTNTGDQTITLTGDVTGSGTGSFAATLSNTTVTPGSYTLTSLTVDSKGRITSAASGSALIYGEPYTTSTTINASLYTISKFTASGPVTIPKPINLPVSVVGWTGTYFILNGGAGLLTWFTTIQWRGGAVPTLSGTGQTDIFVLTTFDAGTNWFGTPIQGYV